MYWYLNAPLELRASYASVGYGVDTGSLILSDDP